MHEVLATRLRQRARWIELARTFVQDFSYRHPILAAVVVGSVARGDFNVWSDLDLIIVSEDLPLRLPERSMLFVDAPAGLQTVAFLPQEFEIAVKKRNPMVLEALREGIVLQGNDFLDAFAAIS